jgi:hypothetical protein
MSGTTIAHSGTRLQVPPQIVGSPGAIASYCGRAERDGSGWRCNCPICGRHSLTIKSFPFLFRCWNCEACSINNGYTEQRQIFVDAGLLEPNKYQLPFNKREYLLFCAKKRAEAARLWNHPWYEPVVPGTVAAEYLKARGLGAFIGHPALPLRCLGLTLMACATHAQCGITAVQHTTLLFDGSDRDRSEHRTRGVRRGGAVWIGDPNPDEWFVVAEGLETMMSAMLILGLKCGAAILGKDFKNLVLPVGARLPHIAADSNETGIMAAEVAAKLWQAHGLKVRMSAPEKANSDFNDMLLGR